MTNPFTPTFGIVPQYLAGRKNILSEMRRAFLRGPGDPNLTSILIGPRGSGKTALLTCIAEEAQKTGWLSVDTVAMDGMLDDILQRALDAAAEYLSPKENVQLTGLSVGKFLGLSWTKVPEEELNWRSRMTELLSELKKRDIGLLITVDEVRVDNPEMIHLVTVYQLLLRSGAKLALVMAGLPGQIHQIMIHEEVSFIRRARQHVLAKIPDRDIREAFRKTVLSSGKSIDNDALDQAVITSHGFAYMMQLVGYFMWEESGEDVNITLSYAEDGIHLAQKDFTNGVLESSWRELSKGDQRFLIAMLEDPDYSTLKDVAKRLGKSTGYASTYKTRLLYSGLIENTGAATFAFAIPFLREYVENAASMETGT